MPKSKPGELAALRDEVATLAQGRCEWPTCGQAGMQMAHITHRGMGGSAERNTIDNVLWLCLFHHDILDGRTGVSGARREINELLRHVVVENRRRGG